MTPARTLLSALLVLSSVALAQPAPQQPAPSEAQTPAAGQAPAEPAETPAAAEKKAPAAQKAPAAATKKISISYRGSLRDALKQIAAKGGINLVVSGGLDQPAEVYLTDVTPEEALRTVAEAYDLKIASSGRIWTLRPMTPFERSQAGAMPGPAAPVPPAPVIAQPPTPAPANESSEELEERLEREQVERERELERAQEERDRELERAERERERALEQQARARDRAQRQVERKMRQLERHNEDDFVVYGGADDKELPEGTTVDNAVVYGGKLTINGHVEGDAVIFGGHLHLGPTAVVEGDVVSLGGSITRDQGAVVEGEQVSIGGTGAVGLGKIMKKLPHGRGPGPDVDEEARSSHRGFSLPGFLVWFAVLFGIGFLAMVLAPNRMKQVESELARDPIKCALTGIVAALAFIPLFILLCVTVIGIPIALALALVAPLAAAVGLAVVASEIGLRLPVFRGKKSQAVVLALGLFLILVIGLIPYVGAFVVAVLVLLGLGAIVRTRFGIKPRGFPEPVV